MTRDKERQERSHEAPIIGGLPDMPGILAAIGLTPGLGTHLSGLADQLLVVDFPGASLTRGERELLALAVSAGNDCFFCMDSHGAFARELLGRAGVVDAGTLVDDLKRGVTAQLSAKLRALVAIALIVRRDARALARSDVEQALAAGATDADTQLAVLIAAAFCMYNRMVDGLRAPTPPSPEVYRGRAEQIADHGYADPPGAAVPR